MAKLQLPTWQALQSRFTLPVVAISIVAAVVFAIQLVREQNRVYYLNLATAGRDGEYYAFGQALAEVVARHEPSIRIRVLETAGSLENMTLLEKRWVHLALVQSDTPVEPSVQAIAFLFPEVFHFLAAADADIEAVPDLRGKRIALMPEGSGSYDLFWPFIQHYGLTAEDFTALPLPSEQAHLALQQGEADALFRIIAVGNPNVGELLRTSGAQLLPIDQVAALQLSLPYLEATTIPRGTYDGEQPIPADELPAVAVRGVLATHDEVEASVIHAITRILYEYRNELINEYPRASNIRFPDSGANLGFPLHQGARSYYNQDQPSFLVQYAEPMGLLLSVSILALSAIWQFRLWLLERQKNRADMYNLEILALIDQVHDVKDLETLEGLRRKLFEILQKVVVDLDVDRISPESFQSFTFPWEVAITTIRHKEVLLLNILPDEEKE